MRPGGAWLFAVLATMGIFPDIDATPTIMVINERATGFQLVPNKHMLESSGLSSTCQSVLGQSIACNEYVARLGKKVYHGSLDDAELTDSVCSAPCQRALTVAQRRVQGACFSTPDLFPGYPVIALIDSIVTGWNETCLLDTKSGKYCNDIIEGWDDYDDISEIPQEYLCSYCYGEKLRMMQRSPYSAFGSTYAEVLTYVNKKCKTTSPVIEQPNPIHVNETEQVTCFSGIYYTTKAGDTCDSIALDNLVSAASLYYLNPNLLNCTTVPVGLELCLPDKCQDVYQVTGTDEDCVEVALNAGTTWMKLVDWNLALDSRCSNLWSNDPFWCRVICVSPPGGDYEDGDFGGTNQTGNGDLGGEGGSGDGYSGHVVQPPSGAVLAEGTTKRCGQYIQAEKGIACASMLSTAAVPMDLFLTVNPSLGKATECDSKLVPGAWYCLKPFRYWNGSMS